MDGFALAKGWLSQRDREFLYKAVFAAEETAPFIHYDTKHGAPIRASMTAIGYGWISTRDGYGYALTQPKTGKRFMPLDHVLIGMAQNLLLDVGCKEQPDFDALLINRYLPGCTMAPHRDRDEYVDAAIVCFSLGGPAEFLFNGVTYALEDGDAYAFWGPMRNALHGIQSTQGLRYALTYRQVYALTGAAI